MTKSQSHYLTNRIKGQRVGDHPMCRGARYILNVTYNFI